MRGRKGDIVRVQHMIEAIELIDTFLQHEDYHSYQKDLKLRLAIAKLLENMGEAASKVTTSLQADYPEVEWLKIKDFRNIIAHEYFGLDYDLIWNLIQQKLPQLKAALKTIHRKLQTDN